MKKVLLFILGLFIILPVFALENRLYFTESGDKLYYDSKLIDEDVFMKYLDLVPGSKNTEELIIENGTKTTCKLFFKVVPREQNEIAEELLNNIQMKIYLDNILVYDGMAKGLDYNSSGVNLQDTILLDTFISNKTALMRVETVLNETYTNPDDDDTSVIDWAFYGQCDDHVTPDPEPKPEPEPKPDSEPKPEPDVPAIKIEPTPQTGITTNVIIYMSTVICAAIVLLIVFILDRKKKNNDK